MSGSETLGRTGLGLTVKTAVLEFVHALFTPLATLYVIVAFPAATPSTIPVVESIVAIPVALLDHVPPFVALVKVLDPPTHKFKVPDIELTVGILVTVELGIVNCKSTLAPLDVMDNVPVYIPVFAEALNLIKTVVVVNAPELVCGSTKLVA
jgi:hypothetical protein